MTVAPNSFNGWGPDGNSSQLPPGASPPLVAAPTTPIAGQGQLVVYNSAGDMQLADGTVPGLIPAGRIFPDKITPLSAVDGAASANVWTGMGQGDKSSTDANDGFTKADVCTPAFAKDGNTLGKLASTRTLVGLVFGVVKDNFPISWVGPAAQAVARAVMMANAYPLASVEVADAAASTTTAEQAILRPAVRGTIDSITFTGAAIAADNTDYITVTVSKRNGSGGGATVLGTYDSRAANNGAVTAFVPASFTLSVVAGALTLLSTDIITITIAKGGSGKVITGAFLVNGKAI